MELTKIKSEDLIFSYEIEDDRTNTYLHLYDYDWMDYHLITRFRTKEMGTLEITFCYFGMVSSRMEVQQTLNDKTRNIVFEYPTSLFQKHLINYLTKHIASWNEVYAFNGELEVIDFYNDVLENGTLTQQEDWK